MVGDASGAGRLSNNPRAQGDHDDFAVRPAGNGTGSPVSEPTNYNSAKTNW